MANIQDFPEIVNYRFFAPTEIFFGWGEHRELGAHVARLGRRALILTGGEHLDTSGTFEAIVSSLEHAGIRCRRIGRLGREPQTTDIDRLVAETRRLDPKPGDFLLAIGGGAVIDAAKAIAGLALDPRDVRIVDFLENVGRGYRLVVDPMPLAAVPTTAGTGAEVTKNAVISSLDPPFKKSFRDPRLIPQVAIVDPELTVSCPKSVTAAAGMDAITQLIESYISKTAKPIPRALAISILPSALHALPRAFEDPDDRRARTVMAQAALLSGMCLANSGLGMAHGVAAALGVFNGVPHGLACAVMLPVALRTNRSVCTESLVELAEATGTAPADAAADTAVDALIDRIEVLCERLEIPRRLRDLGVDREQLPAIAKASYGNSMNGNPRTLSVDELTAILEAAW
ncbi:MAG: iron-containing alcohol dehydrogenase [Planctomycetota bacterium]|nr:MAG: iron-containing alcohol dehydrogenase [Planctomycetota bacterium]